MAKHHPDLIMCRKQPGISIGRLCEVRRCVNCGGVGISDAYYCKECTQQEKDRDGCPKIVNLGSAKTDLFYERKKVWFQEKMTISRRTTTVEETLTFEIKPGWKKGTKITFPEKGNERRGIIPADLVFIIDEMPHSVYKRDGDDLIVTQKISLAEALMGHTAQLTALDGRNLSVSIDSIISQTHEEVVRGEGMPNHKEPSKKGNLIVKFSVKFPKLTSEQKTGIRMLLTSL